MLLEGLHWALALLYSAAGAAFAIVTVGFVVKFGIEGARRLAPPGAPARLRGQLRGMRRRGRRPR